jgi:hypothetical protein
MMESLSASSRLVVKSIISDREFVIEQLEHYIRGAKT